MNWHLLSKRSAGDVLMNIKMLIDDRQNGIKSQINTFMRDPLLSHLFADHGIQRQFVSFSAAVQKVIDVASQYRDYTAAQERLRSARQVLTTLCDELTRRTRRNFHAHQAVKTIAADLNDVEKELQTIMKMNPPATNTRGQEGTKMPPTAQPAPQQSAPNYPKTAARKADVIPAPGGRFGPLVQSGFGWIDPQGVPHATTVYGHMGIIKQMPEYKARIAQIEEMRQREQWQRDEFAGVHEEDDDDEHSDGHIGWHSYDNSYDSEIERLEHEMMGELYAKGWIRMMGSDMESLMAAESLRSVLSRAKPILTELLDELNAYNRYGRNGRVWRIKTRNFDGGNGYEIDPSQFR